MMACIDLSGGSRHDFLQDLVGQCVLRGFQFVGGLEVHPHLSGGAEIVAQSERGVRRYSALPVQDGGDPVSWDPQGEGKRISGPPGCTGGSFFLLAMFRFL
jgi:hypothetical protein